MKGMKRICVSVLSLALLLGTVTPAYAMEQPPVSDVEVTEPTEPEPLSGKEGLNEELVKWFGIGREGIDDPRYGVKRARRARSTSDGDKVYIEPGTKHYYGSWSTCEFTIGDALGYCAQPNSATPSGYFSAYSLKNDTIKALLMLAPGGPLYSQAFWNTYGTNPATGGKDGNNDAYALAHAAIGLTYSGQTTGLTKVDVKEINAYINLAYETAVASTVWKQYRAFVAPNSKQDIVWMEGVPEGSVTMKKESSVPEITSENHAYSLAGAVYKVYSDEGCTKEVATLITDDSGSSDTITLPVGTYYAKEVSASKGYSLDETVYTVIVEPGTETSFTSRENPLYGTLGLVIEKIDQEIGKRHSQGGASMAGAEFTVRYYAGSDLTETSIKDKEPARTWVFATDDNGQIKYRPDYKVSGDDLFLNTQEAPVIPFGAITIRETKAPEGYQVNPTEYFFAITEAQAGTTAFQAPTVKEAVIRGDVRILKEDAQLKVGKQAQGNGSLEGVKFQIRSLNPNSVRINGKDFQEGDVVTEISTIIRAGKAVAETKGQLLPYGSYEIREIKASTGYRLTDGEPRTFRVKNAGEIVTGSIKGEELIFRNQIIRGGVRIQKVDQDTKDTKTQGDAVLSKAVYEIINQSENAVVVGDQTYAPGDRVITIETDDTGVAQTSPDTLPYGDYLIREITPSKGYLLDQSWSQTFSVRNDKEMVDLTATPSEEPIIRGDVQVQKWDKELDKSEAIGGADHGGNTTGSHLEGVAFEIRNLSPQPVMVGGKLIPTGEVAATIISHWNTEMKAYTAETKNKALPYGTYGIKETETSEGYLLSDGAERIFHIREDGSLVTQDQTDNNLIWKNQVTRNDFELVKISDRTSKRLSVPFRLTNLTTGEAHIVVTDKNGEFSSATSWNAHSKNTNGNDFVLDYGEKQIVKMKDLDKQAGLWFGKGEDGSVATVNDQLSALPYGDYELKELRSDSNKKYELQTIRFTIYKDATVRRPVDLGTVTDDELPQPVLKTTAVDTRTKDHLGLPLENAEISDQVAFKNVKPGTEYLIKGILMDAAAKKPVLINGAVVSAETTITPQDKEGVASVLFQFNASSLKGKDVVVFESMYAEGILIAEHTDFKDKTQTIHYPEHSISTSASDMETKEHTGILHKKVTVLDTVSYKGLIPGLTYTVQGTLMDQSSKSEFLADGKPVTASVEFVPETANGKVELSFQIDGRDFEPVTLVVFEKLLYEGKELSVHADINDRHQTVTYKKPEIHIQTTASGKNHKKEILPEEKAVIVDRVSMKGLETENPYLLKGWLMKEDGTALLIDGKQVTVEKEFVSGGENMDVEMEFTFDVQDLAGQNLVVFEELYDLHLSEKPEKVAEHKDLKDEGQTVTIKEKPGEPEEPGTPTKPDTPKDSTPKKPSPDKPSSTPQVGRTIPKTGDNNPIGFLLLTLLMAGSAATILYIRKGGGTGKS